MVSGENNGVGGIGGINTVNNEEVIRLVSIHWTPREGSSNTLPIEPQGGTSSFC